MHFLLIFGSLIVGVAWVVICWLGCQLLRQNGRLLLRLEGLEQRLDELEFGEASAVDSTKASGNIPQATGGRASRFQSHSLACSKIPRDGLKPGTPAPQFRLPCLDGGELALEDLRGNQVLLVFSDPDCAPCDALAPQLEELHHRQSQVRVVMISRGEPKANRVKVRKHRLSFPVVLQQHWEISHRYAMFATPCAYLIDGAGVILRGVALGADAILALITEALPPSISPSSSPATPRMTISIAHRTELLGPQLARTWET